MGTAGRAAAPVHGQTRTLPQSWIQQLQTSHASVLTHRNQQSLQIRTPLPAKPTLNISALPMWLTELPPLGPVSAGSLSNLGEPPTSSGCKFN